MGFITISNSVVHVHMNGGVQTIEVVGATDLDQVTREALDRARGNQDQARVQLRTSCSPQDLRDALHSDNRFTWRSMAGLQKVLDHIEPDVVQTMVDQMVRQGFLRTCLNNDGTTIYSDQF